MTPADVARAFLDVLEPWVAGQVDVEIVQRRYWSLRRKLLKEGAPFTGRVGEVLSTMDGSMDSYYANPAPAAVEINAPQLRAEVDSLLPELRILAGLPEVFGSG